MSAVLRANAQVEGLFRKAGSQTRQKDIKRLLDAGGCISNGQHPIDVASILKLYLRCLPEPLISAEVQDLLLRCRITAGEDALKPLLHTLLLLPVLHVHLLHYIMELLNFIASKHKENLMDASNLAIVMAPSIMPLPAASSAQRLEHHVALVKIFIENSQHIGLLTEDLMTQLDEDSDGYLARKKKRRSGSLNRMLSGLRKMVSGSVHTPAAVRDNPNAPVISKSGSKRKFDTYEGFSSKTRKEITKNLPQKELMFTPMKVGIERKRVRLSLMDARSTPVMNSGYSSKHNSATSASSDETFTSTENLFSAHDTIDLSPEMKQESHTDYVKISKQEYEEIKNRVSAIENRLSKEFTDVIPRVETLQQVQDVYQQTLEEVAMLNCPTSDHLARRLSKELKIRPNEHAKIIRSPSARKIGSIRRRSKENIFRVVRHKSLNAASQSNNVGDRFYPLEGLNRRERTSSSKSEAKHKSQANTSNDCDNSMSENSMYTSQKSQKYQTRKRYSMAECNLNKTIGKPFVRRSLNITMNSSWDNTVSENSMNTDCSRKSNDSVEQRLYQNVNMERRSPVRQRWRNAATFFMNKTGELDNEGQGRPSVNKLRQNAGAVLAKARIFESSSDKSSEFNEGNAKFGFARKPRVPNTKVNKTVSPAKQKISNPPDVVPSVQSRNYRQISHKYDGDSWKRNRRSTPVKQPTSPPPIKSPPITPALKKPLVIPRNLRTPSIVDHRKTNTPLKAVHISPRRKSPRQKSRTLQLS